MAPRFVKDREIGEFFFRTANLVSRARRTNDRTVLGFQSVATRQFAVPSSSVMRRNPGLIPSLIPAIFERQGNGRRLMSHGVCSLFYCAKPLSFRLQRGLLLVTTPPRCRLIRIDQEIRRNLNCSVLPMASKSETLEAS
jgi:hypothetical protein